MRAKVRQALDAIEDVLLQGDEDARDLAAILSALRGPDGPGMTSRRVHTRKLNSTCVVRRLAFPRIAQQADEDPDKATAAMACGWLMGLPDQTTITVPAGENYCGAHFEQHLKDAAVALGQLPW